MIQVIKENQRAFFHNGRNFQLGEVKFTGDKINNTMYVRYDFKYGAISTNKSFNACLSEFIEAHLDKQRGFKFLFKE